MKERKNIARGHTTQSKVPQATFVRGVIGTDPILGDKKPVVAFAGRSNVGKSSTLNAVLGTRIARTSATPGKTQEINFYDVGGRGYFVDLPGYGYANMPVQNAEKIRKRIIWYLSSGEARPALLVLVLDAKVGVTAYDRELITLAQGEGHPLLIIANKIDKLNQRERGAALTHLAEEFPDAECIPFSATKKEPLDLLRKRLFGALVSRR